MVDGAGGTQPAAAGGGACGNPGRMLLARGEHRRLERRTGAPCAVLRAPRAVGQSSLREARELEALGHDGALLERHPRAPLEAPPPAPEVSDMSPNGCPICLRSERSGGWAGST